MSKLKIFIFYWVPAFCLMGVIFALSSRQRINVSESYAVNFSLFKTLHVLEYALLYFLLFRAFLKSLHKEKKKNAYLFAVIVSVLYAISDELHQTLTPTREGSPRDILIDTIGIYLMFQYTKNYLHHLKWFL